MSQIIIDLNNTNESENLWQIDDGYDRTELAIELMNVIRCNHFRRINGERPYDFESI